MRQVPFTAWLDALVSAGLLIGVALLLHADLLLVDILAIVMTVVVKKPSFWGRRGRIANAVLFNGAIAIVGGCSVLVTHASGLVKASLFGIALGLPLFAVGLCVTRENRLERRTGQSDPA